MIEKKENYVILMKGKGERGDRGEKKTECIREGEKGKEGEKQG